MAKQTTRIQKVTFLDVFTATAFFFLIKLIILNIFWKIPLIFPLSSLMYIYFYLPLTDISFNIFFFLIYSVLFKLLLLVLFHPLYSQGAYEY